ncbi:prolipoprotein diacylglyceryl transferase family protein [Oricola sp.]|uniref:prolipoprotein diacylglyceryl transferase family protein n=1 Tax=Oricola sp. TaxID=1979950 RepID=UPI000C955E10|nr:diacylglyceryl transferase [Ahrensia sp.]|tara:strand:- start:11459 stop:12172 length:714 start_codon:yes stop_codon:yes gene_type:complete
MSFPAIHALFDFLAWAVSLTALLLLRRTWFSERPVEKHLRFGYLVGVLFGAGAGAWLFGTLNLWVSGIGGFGRSIEGAIVGAVAAIEIYKRASGITVRTGAIYALPMALGIAVGRIGCLLSGLVDNTHGIATGADWGWDFGDGVLRHPVQLYESLAMAGFALVYVAMVATGSARWKRDGFYYAVGFYAVQRFVIEFWKPYGALVAGLTVFQFLSIVLLGYALVMAVTAERAAMLQRP